MAKKSQLLGETNPETLKELTIGSFLAVFVFAGAFLAADATVYLATGSSTLTANVISLDVGEILCASAAGCN